MIPAIPPADWPFLVGGALAALFLVMRSGYRVSAWCKTWGFEIAPGDRKASRKPSALGKAEDGTR